MEKKKLAATLTIIFYAVCVFASGFMFVFLDEEAIPILDNDYYSAYHNIDIAYNAMNIECGYCASEITDFGKDLQGNDVNLSISAYYRNSMHYFDKYPKIIGVVHFGKGVLLVVMVISALSMMNGAFRLRKLEKDGGS